MATSTNSIRIETTSLSRDRVLDLPRDVMNDLEIEPGSYVLRFGSKQIRVDVRQQKVRGKDQGTAFVSRDVVEELHLPDGAALPLLKGEEEQLRLGYVYGILANVKTDDSEQVTGQQALVFQNLLEAAAQLDLYGYVFSPLDIDWQDLSTIGYRLKPLGRWCKVRVPLPDVVYDQIVSRRFENRDDVALERERLYQWLSPRFFNPGYFDKWQVHEWLSSHSRTVSFVPDTICFQSTEQAAEFLYRHSDAYLKPVHGSLGVGIIRFKRLQDGRVYYQLKKQDGQLLQKYEGSISTFLKKHHKRLRRGPYLFQQALRLMTWQDRPFDIRLVLQKDRTGKWKRTKAFCRVAQEGQITSNLSTGGDALGVKQVLLEILQDEKRVSRVMKELRQIATDVPAVIEEEHGGTIGELGLDLGLDEDGRIWVIEVNAKPWKKPNIEESEWRDLAWLAFQRPVQFAKYLCESYRDG